jgi:uncharacterized HAD superfamily protein/calcineurin-like phosphoesterase family protein
MLKSVAFDIDGTITDELNFVVTHFHNAYKEKFGKEYTKPCDYSIYPPENMFDEFVDDKDWLKSWKDALWDAIIKGNGIPVRKNVKELTNGLHKNGYTVHIVTARCGDDSENTPENLAAKEDTIRKWLKREGIYYDTFHFGLYDKVAQLSGIGVDVIVEDSPKQALQIAPKFSVFLIDKPYNKYVKGANIWRLMDDSDLVTERFIEKLKYAEDHAQMFTESMDDVFFEEADEPNFTIKDDKIMFYKKESKKKNIIFVVPARTVNTDIENFSLDALARVPDAKIFRLSLLSGHEQPVHLSQITSADTIVREAMRKNMKKGIDINDTQSTATYIYKVNVIKELLKYAKEHPKQIFIFDGLEVMMLERGEIEKYVDYPFVITRCNEKDFGIIRRKQNKKDYNQFLLMEDLTDVSTQLRKWRIIAGTAKNELKTYINRQYSDSNGVDCVHLLDGERPYRPDLLQSALSPDTFLIGDLHLSTTDKKKTDQIIRNINSRVGRDSKLLILGDLDGKKGTGSWKLCKDTLAKLNTKNLYFILGNNDPYPIEDYVKMGFLSVTDMATYDITSSEKVILTHCPYPVKNDEVNIHGHIHGSRCYWNLDWHNHYDVWDQDFFPTTIREALDIVHKGLYTAVTEIHKNY